MMNLRDRIASFSELGYILGEALKPVGELNSRIVREAMDQAMILNPWFTRENCNYAIRSIHENLTSGSLEKWLERYPIPENKKSTPGTIGVIMAGNIPLVGFHDMLCVLMSGNRILAKPSSKDTVLLKAIAETLIVINKDWKEYIRITEGTLSSFDAIIATGSNNSSRYFEYYFGSYPHIIRKNRNSVAVLTGDETNEELTALGEDIFLYFGLGCRSVSKVYLPLEYDLSTLSGAFGNFSHYGYHNKYMNNYDYFKSIYIINKVSFIDNHFFLLTENPAITSPISVVYFGYAGEKQKLISDLYNSRDQLQCIVSKDPEIPGAILPGKAQRPALWDYSDNIDTMEFLLNVN